jgi:hypothetical protein
VIIFLLFLVIPFSRGEVMSYKVSYGVVPAGVMTLKAKWDSFKGDSVWHFSLRVRTKGGISVFFKVDDKIESFVDPASFRTLKYQKILKEGKYRINRSAIYDHENRRVYYSDGDTTALYQGAIDPLSLFYYLRTFRLNPGDSIRVPYHVDKKNDSVTIVVKGIDTLETPLGIYEAIVVRPKFRGKNIFSGKGGMDIWISLKEPHLILRVETEVSFGHLKAEITSYQRSRS